MGRSALWLCLTLGCISPVDPVRVQVAAEAIAIDETTVEVRFTAPVDPGSIDLSRMRAFSMFDRPAETLEVRDVAVDGEALLVTTQQHRGGALYALALGEVRFQGIEAADYPQQVNFHGFGRTDVSIRINTTGFIPPDGLDVLMTIDPATGDYSDRLQAFALTESAPNVWTTTVSARILPERIFAARAVTDAGAQAAQLTTFRIADDQTVRVELLPTLPRIPEFTAPLDPTPGDGFAPVRVIFDDRLGRALRSPQLRASLDAAGNFDLASDRLETMRPLPGKGRVYETMLEVAVDPTRTLDGTTPETFPYVIFLVEAGVDIAQRGATFEMAEERPQVIVIPMGNPEKVPVTFRVDIKDAFLSPDGAERGLYPGEGLFLTGELPSAEDALGRLAADAFTGGERATLEMEERPDAPGIFEKTIFLPPNRPYGWKVLRCPTGEGCAELNRHVLSSGRAFPTVMKNLVSQNQDAAAAAEVSLIDPADPQMFAGATVSQDGSESPSPTVMFKQEVPDLVVSVGAEPVFTPVVVVGTWRDINIPQTPAEIIAEGGTLDLNPFDYDDGFQGRSPLTRDIDLPVDPGAAMTRPGVPAYDATDGLLDSAATEVEPGVYVGWNDESLYVAVDPATPGRDHFLLISLDAPNAERPAHWAKQGNIARSDRSLLVAMEGDGDFSAWFRLGATPAEDVELGTGSVTGRGAVLEATIDPVAAGLGGLADRVYVSFLAYGTNDGDPLLEQIPAGNSNLDVEAAELMPVDLAAVR